MKTKVKMFALVVATALVLTACQEEIINPSDEGKAEVKAQVLSVEPNGLKKLTIQK
ncbi:MAG: hypothetical protein M9954_06645 [Cyclobacteriaceae bacterium]|nr:hypothetical protein [Cyclobacteriaceae bacterium]MCB0500031.1 hypothetical protein [Cyclobacteriaceae bacterium]MCB9239367.1 hypothetical protein [Flammeovirgaceae bacterium]MCO5271320.1 hypothetical protein [Cyclobacteriaceae bacterium]MCW5903643.1 hypothetical protein [Cyclobacteriaceae bacterium]